MTPAQQKQFARLSAAVCETRLSSAYDRHALVKVSTRRIRDWFRERVYWRCHCCDLREEVVSPKEKLPPHTWHHMTGVCTRCGLVSAKDVGLNPECFG